MKKIIVMILLAIFLSSCSKNTYTIVVKNNWDIELPTIGSNELFSYSEPSFHGDGIRYHVINYPNNVQIETIKLQLEEVFSTASLPTNQQIDEANQLLEGVNIEKELVPQWDKCQLVYKSKDDNSKLYLFYCNDTTTVYIVESFI